MKCLKIHQFNFYSYRQSFGDDYFSFWLGGVLFIAINSQFYEVKYLKQMFGRLQNRLS